MNAKMRDSIEDNRVPTNRAVLWACLWVVAAGITSTYSPKLPRTAVSVVTAEPAVVRVESLSPKEAGRSRLFEAQNPGFCPVRDQ